MSLALLQRARELVRSEQRIPLVPRRRGQRRANCQAPFLLFKSDDGHGNCMLIHLDDLYTLSSLACSVALQLLLALHTRLERLAVLVQCWQKSDGVGVVRGPGG